MKLPTHYIPPVEQDSNGVRFLIYGWKTPDGMFTSIDGRKFSGEIALPINPPNDPQSQKITLA